MEVIQQKKWEYLFVKENNEYYLEVICGNVGIFEIKVKLEKEELDNYNNEGFSAIEKLIKNIQEFPSNFANRNIK